MREIEKITRSTIYVYVISELFNTKRKLQRIMRENLINKKTR